MTGTHGVLALDVLGAGPAYSDRAGAIGASYLVKHGDTRLVLDLGHGTFSRLAGALEPSGLDALVVSHLHPDHFVDLVPLRHYLRWELTPPRRMRIVGPGALAERLDCLHAQPGFSNEAFDLEALGSYTFQVGSLQIEARRVTHTDDSYGFRVAPINGGTGLVYSGDCGVPEDLDPLVRAGDTLLCEVSFGPGPGDPNAAHLDGPQVGALASRTGAARVLLTHLQMGHDREETVASVCREYDGPAELVDPGFSVAIE